MEIIRGASPYVPTTTSGTDPPNATKRTPGNVLNLTNWKLTIPAGGKKAATEILQPRLATYTDKHFLINAAGNGVTMSAPCGAPTTHGTTYPRCELRQMVGAAEASWSCTGRGHLTVVESVDVLPKVKPEVVCAQIHNASDDVVEVLATGLDSTLGKGHVALTVRFRGKTQTVHLDDDYALGTPFTLDVDVADGAIAIGYNGAAPVLTLKASDGGCYFKAGAYVQSNVSHGDKANAYGQVTVYVLTVS